MKSFRMISILLVLSVLILAFAACGSSPSDDPGDGKTTESGQQSGDPASGKDTETESETVYMPVLPDTVYNTTFTCLHWTVDETWIPWDEVSVDKINGDIMNDTVYDRNHAVGERFGVTFSTEYMETYAMNDMVKNLVLTNNPEYDLVVQRGVCVAQIYADGLFHSIDECTYIDINNPWWSKDSLESLALGNVKQFVVSDMLVLDKGASACVFFNQVVAEQYREVTGDIYETVRQKQWTLPEMIRICEGVAQDLDNDGRINGDNDLIACLSSDDPVHFLYTGAGLRFMDHDETGHFEYLYGEEDSIIIHQEIFDTFLYAPFFRNGYVDPCPIPKFEADEELFGIAVVKSTNNLRANKSDYGILPIPMFEDIQNRYYTEVSPHHDSLMCIPLSVKDLQFTGVMLEALAAEAYYTSYPTFFNVIINGRSVRDEESREMLKIIFETRVYDAGLVFDLDDFASQVLRLTAKESVNVAQVYASYRNPISSRLKDLNKMVDKLNGWDQDD